MLEPMGSPRSKLVREKIMIQAGKGTRSSNCLETSSIIYQTQQSRVMFGPRGFNSRYCLTVIITMILMAVLWQQSNISGEAGMDSFLPSAPPSSGNWTVTGSESYTDTTISIEGNISISGSLVLDNVTLRINSSSIGPNWLAVLNGGSLIMRNGSLLTGFNVGSFHARALPGSYFELNGSEVAGCGINGEALEESGLYSETDNFFSFNSTITNSPIGLIGVGSNITLNDTRIVECQERGIKLMNGSNLDMKRCNVTSVIDWGIEISGSNAHLDEITFENCGRAVTIDNSDVWMEDSEIFSNDPLSISISSSNLDMIDCFPAQPGMNGLHLPVSNSPSEVFLLNTTVTEVLVEGNSVVREAFRHDIRVTTNGGEPAFLADVEVKGSDGNIEGHGLTDEDGWIHDLPLIGIKHDRFGMHYQEPHNLSVLLEGAVREKDFNSTRSHFTSISVIIRDPVVEFTYPENGTWMDTRSFTVTGKVIDPRPISGLVMFLDGGAEVVLNPRKTFSIPLTFGSDGEHILRVKATNDDWRESDSSLHFGIDTLDPELSVATPGDETYTSSANINVSGTCEIDAKLFINEDLVEHGSGTFFYEVHLMEGWNDIVVRAVDRAGNQVEITRKVYLDSTPPSLRVLSPVNGTTIKNNYVVIEGIISHDTVAVTVNGVEIEFDMMGFSYRLENLTEGENRIVVEARDRTGSVSKSAIWIIVDSDPPWIELVRPPAYTNKTSMVLTGNVERGSNVVVGGSLAEVNNGIFRAEVALFQGLNNISVIATDAVGNSRTVYAETILDRESPTFERIEPIDGSILDTMVVQLTGVVFDDHEIKGVWGSNATTPRQLITRNETLNWVVMLSSGENIFILEAEDMAGNSRMIELRYTYESDRDTDTVKPSITITSPLSNETLPVGEITVSGTASDDRSLEMVEIRTGDGEWKIVTVTGSRWNATLFLERGVHLIQARAVDGSGNEAIDTVKVTAVNRSGEENGENGDGLEPIFMIILVAVIALAVVLLIYLVLRNSMLRKEWNEMEESSKKDESRKTGRRPPPERRKPSVRERGARMDRGRRPLPRDLPDIEESGPGRRRP
jgi:hypothetical protein